MPGGRGLQTLLPVSPTVPWWPGVEASNPVQWSAGHWLARSAGWERASTRRDGRQSPGALGWVAVPPWLTSMMMRVGPCRAVPGAPGEGLATANPRQWVHIGGGGGKTTAEFMDGRMDRGGRASPTAPSPSAARDRARESSVSPPRSPGPPAPSQEGIGGRSACSTGKTYPCQGRGGSTAAPLWSPRGGGTGIPACAGMMGREAGLRLALQ